MSIKRAVGLNYINTMRILAMRHVIRGIRINTDRVSPDQPAHQRYTVRLYVNEILFYRRADSVALGSDRVDAHVELDYTIRICPKILFRLTYDMKIFVVLYCI